MSQNKYLDLLKKLVYKHPGLADAQQKLDAAAAGNDLRLALIDKDLVEIHDCAPITRKPAVVKWIAPSRHASPRLALEVEGRLLTVYGYGKDLPELVEGMRLEVDVKPDPYGTYDVVAYHLPAQALTAADAEAGA